jgi:hypothetical protein
MNNKAIIALAILIGCVEAETETSSTPEQTETENTTAEATNSETTENTTNNTIENTAGTVKEPKTTTDNESAVSSD